MNYSQKTPVPVIEVFAGMGGLGEGRQIFNSILAGLNA